MKNISKTILLFSCIFVCFMSFGSFADTFIDGINSNTIQNGLTYDQYVVASEQLRVQINALSDNTNEYKKYIEAARFKLEQIEKTYKETRNLSIPEEKFKQAKELRKSIVIKSIKDESIEDSNTVEQLAKSGQYDKAMNKLYAIYDTKAQQFTEYSKAVVIWIQINSLIS